MPTAKLCRLPRWWAVYFVAYADGPDNVAVGTLWRSRSVALLRQQLKNWTLLCPLRPYLRVALGHVIGANKFSAVPIISPPKQLEIKLSILLQLFIPHIFIYRD
jgi:hypothetical protein